MTVPAIILAAGASRRLGQPKQLLKYRGETLLERALRAAKEAGASPVLVLLGAHFAPICAMIPFNDAIPVLNDNGNKAYRVLSTPACTSSTSARPMLLGRS